MITPSILKRSRLDKSLEKENATAAEDLRLQDLKKRFANLGVSVEKIKRAKLDQMEETLASLDLSISALAEDQSLAKTKRSVAELEEQLEEAHLDKDAFEAGFHKRVGIVIEDFRVGLSEIRTDNRALVSEFAKQGADRVFALGLALSKSQKAFQEHLDGYCLTVEERIEQMREQIERENQEREESAENIEIKVMAELEKLEEDIAIERKVKEETTAKMQGLLDEMAAEMSRKIELERQEREQSNSSLLLLLEEACSRIERNFSGFA